MINSLRNTTRADLPGIKAVLDSSALFPSEYLDDMISGYLNDPTSQELWFTCLQDDRIVGFGYCTPEKLTEGTYNLLAIAVSKDVQGRGIGGQMMAYLEQVLKERSARVLIVETSSDAQYEKTRMFYEQLDYAREATIRDFWQEGEDKVVFWKKLN